MRSGELFAALSLATDLGTGQAAEHGLRTCLLALELAELAGLDAEQLEDAYYLGLLHSIGCTADAPVTARAFGDDRAHKAAYTLIDAGRPPEIVSYLWHNVYPTAPTPQRLRAFVSALAAGPGFARVNLRSHCEVGERLGQRLRLPERCCEGLWFVFERWDGKGMPAGAAGERIPIAARILHAARDAAAFAAAGGAEMVCAMAERAAGSSLDPRFAGLLREHAPALLERVGALDAWERVVAAEPRPRLFTGEDLDQACQVIADYADLKSYGTLGHSRAVAEVAEAAGWRLGLTPDAIGELRRAAWLHDMGRARRLGRGLGEARTLDERRMGAGTASQLPHRAAARPDPGAERARSHRRLGPRTTRWLRLSPRGERPAAVASRAGARCGRRVVRDDRAARPPPRPHRERRGAGAARAG